MTLVRIEDIEIVLRKSTNKWIHVEERNKVKKNNEEKLIKKEK